ncbi:hypothetical protein [Halorussus marinus]|uniref:hypothetical protein n=1 Tax=Halorussus marinus TaxID=2505976 RepID=UPI00106E97AA|nr:hypothetical protein [Halorussus marinus]
METTNCNESRRASTATGPASRTRAPADDAGETMPDERESPSAGWRGVCREMAVDTGIEAATARCPDCDRPCPNVAGDAYDCVAHGLFRPGEDRSEDSADPNDRIRGTAD